MIEFIEDFTKEQFYNSITKEHKIKVLLDKIENVRNIQGRNYHELRNKKIEIDKSKDDFDKLTGKSEKLREQEKVLISKLGFLENDFVEIEGYYKKSGSIYYRIKHDDSLNMNGVNKFKITYITFGDNVDSIKTEIVGQSAVLALLKTNKGRIPEKEYNDYYYLILSKFSKEGEDVKIPSSKIRE